MSQPDLIDALRLMLVEGIGPILRTNLLARFGSPRAVFQAAPSEWREVAGVGPKLINALSAARKDTSAAEVELARCRENNIELLVPELERYPRPLSRIPDPPGVLFQFGNWTPGDELSIAVVGTRHASSYGLRVTERLSGGLARAGYTIVSGLARGIDGVAHRAALAAGGRTVAVLGGGLLNIYPPEHKKLAAEILEKNAGAILSESPPLMAPLSHTFPQRNRIITGLCLGVLVVEADKGSGALISARHALEQNKEVFAVPGPIDTVSSRGCHQLIRDGATLVECVEDVLEQLGPLAEPTQHAAEANDVRHPAELQLNEPERQVLQVVPVEVTGIDNIIVASGLPAHRVLAVLSVLEMKRLIRRVSGNLVARI
jgi:DNA processing protein